MTMYQEPQATINPALRDFDQLSDSFGLRPQIAIALLGISIATFWRLVKNGQIKTRKLTERTTTVTAGELRAFIASKMEAK